MEERNFITPLPRAIRTQNRDRNRGRDRGRDRDRHFFLIIKASKTLLLRLRLQNITFICPLSLQMVYELIKHWYVHQIPCEY